MHAIDTTDHRHTTSRSTYPAYYLGRPVTAYHRRYRRSIAEGRGRR